VGRAGRGRDTIATKWNEYLGMNATASWMGDGDLGGIYLLRLANTRTSGW